MTMPKMSPKMQNRMPMVSSLCPSIPRKETCDRSGSFSPASPPAVSGAACASATETFNNNKAAHAAPAIANRLRSERKPASQVYISSPPSKIPNLNICPTLYGLPAHDFALDFVFRAPNQWLTGFATGCLLRLDRGTALSRREHASFPPYRGMDLPKRRIRVGTRHIFITCRSKGVKPFPKLLRCDGGRNSMALGQLAAGNCCYETVCRLSLLWLRFRGGRQQAVQAQVNRKRRVVVDQIVCDFQGGGNAGYLPAAKPRDLISQVCVGQFCKRLRAEIH